MTDKPTLKEQLGKAFLPLSENLKSTLLHNTSNLWAFIEPLDFQVNREYNPFQCLALTNIDPRTQDLDIRVKGLISLVLLLFDDHKKGNIWFKEFLSDLQSINSLSKDDQDLVVITRNCYEMLWGLNKLATSEGDEYLNILMELQGKDEKIGYPLGELGWRIKKQSEILKGFPRWQVCESWLKADKDIWHGINNWEKLEPLYKGWYLKFRDGMLESDEQNESITNIEKNLRHFDKGNTFYSGAIDTYGALSMFHWFSGTPNIVELRHLTKYDEITRIIDRSVHSISDSDNIKDSKEQLEQQLNNLFYNQILTERIALRYWHLKGFIATVAYYSAAQMRTLDELWTKTESGNDEEKVTDNQIIILTHALLSTPWGRPYRPVSKKSLEPVWQRLSGHILSEMESCSIKELLNNLVNEASKTPPPILAVHPIFLLLRDLLSEEHIESLFLYTKTVQQFPRAKSEFEYDVFNLWADIALFYDENNGMSKALELVFNNIHMIHKVNRLIRTVFNQASFETMTPYFSKLEEFTLKYKESEHFDLRNIEDLFYNILEGLVNRKDFNSFEREKLLPLKNIVNKFPEICESDTMKSMLALLDGSNFTEEDDRKYIDIILKKIDELVNNACSRNEKDPVKWGGSYGFLRRPFNLPATEEHAKKINTLLRQFQNAKRPTDQEISTIFDLISDFLPDAEPDLFKQLIDSVIGYGADFRPCLKVDFSYPQKVFDGSWIVWGILSNVSKTLDKDFLERACQILFSRKEEYTEDKLRYTPSTISAIITGPVSKDISDKAQQMLYEKIFKLNRFRTQIPYDYLAKTLKGIRNDGNPETITNLLNTLDSWISSGYQEGMSIYLPWFAYEVGSLSIRISKSDPVNKWSKWLAENPRASVRHQFNMGYAL